MGRVRTKTVKRAAKVLLQKHYLKLTNDFHINKKILSEVAKVPTKSLRNKIAGFATHLMKRIQRGPVKGISLKVQEEERQRRLDWVPKESEININKVTVDTETSEMIKRRFGEDFHTKITPSLQVKNAEVAKKNARDNKRRNKGDGERKERKPRENKQKKEGDKVEKIEEQTKPQAPQAEQTQEQKAAPAKREGRRRGGREGQQ